MKKISIAITIVAMMFLITTTSFALSPTPSPTLKVTPTAKPKENPTPVDTEIEKIKDLVASKVAELKLVDKRAILGTVKTSSNTQIALNDDNGKERQVDIDELTKFESDSDQSFGISDIKNGDTLSVIGLYNKDTRRLLARFVSKEKSVPLNLEGVVASKDTKEFTLVLVAEDGKKKTINIDTSTKTSSYDKGESTKSGFSKIQVDQRIIAVGFADPKIKDQVNASRVIVFAAIPASSLMKKFESVSSSVAPVSSGSAGKIQPITK